MTDRQQTQGREDNGAAPGGKPDAATSDAEVRRTGRRARTSAGPDGPDAKEVGDTFKKTSG
jgi:hypothetical protein